MSEFATTIIPTAVGIPIACAALGVTRATIYRMAARGELRLIKVGGATRIPTTELERIVAGIPAAVAS